ncbi:hypothetical protein ACETU7_20545 [Rhodococcus sp. 3Y1]
MASPITFNETLGSGVTITAPTTAAPGETVTYRVQPNEMKTNSGGHASRGVVHWARIKYDFDIPSGVEFVSSQLVADSAYGLGSDSATPTVTRIDDGGNPSASGTHLRISDRIEPPETVRPPQFDRVTASSSVPTPSSDSPQSTSRSKLVRPVPRSSLR